MDSTRFGYHDASVNHFVQHMFLEMAGQKFERYEKVRVKTVDPEISALNGLLAAVLGWARDENGSWCYAIHVYKFSAVYSITESDLVASGEYAKREDFYSGESIRVSRDGDVVG
ncbi:MAG: hypothetical protein AAF664_10770 [Planctomycetota bacterium]